ncbi:MAG: MFS transporter [Alicyclobacillus herbarius]|uniref:MFS transporter n=1 Tax=Alicyclobacillus herbarius TaxID=122960 RepID=UPI0003F6ABC6|nr:MFS transporter [Alicyclobacillus herbarius]MCL6633119.1 MFS transporter [Alicyclobacillus herbarius]
MSSSRQRSNRPSHVLFYLVTMLYWFAMYTYVPILSPYIRAIGGSYFFVGVVIGSYGFTQMLLRVPLGIWSDRLGRRKLFIVSGVACAALSSLGFALTSDSWSALGWRALAGVAAASWVAFTVFFSSSFPPEEAPRAMGLISLYTSLGQMAATTLGGFLAEDYGWHAPFWVGAGGGLLGLVLAFFIRESVTVARTPARVGELLRMGRSWPLLSVSLLAIFGQSVTFTTMYGFTSLAAVHIGASKAALSVLTLATTLPNAVAGYVGGTYFVRWFGERVTVSAGFICAALATAVVPVVHTLLVLMLTQAVNGFAQGVLIPILMGLSIRAVPENRRATAMGFFQAIYSIGMCAGPFVSGWLGQWLGLSGVFWFTACVSVIGGLLCLIWIPRVRLLKPTSTTARVG